jgi:hypothetical protein
VRHRIGSVGLTDPWSARKKSTRNLDGPEDESRRRGGLRPSDFRGRSFDLELSTAHINALVARPPPIPGSPASPSRGLDLAGLLEIAPDSEKGIPDLTFAELVPLGS